VARAIWSRCCALALAGCSSNARFAAIEHRLDQIESASRVSAAVATQLQVPSQPDNLRVEDAFDKGWFMSGAGADYYGATRDSSVRRDGRAPILLAPTHETYDKEASWMTSLDAVPYRGKRIRVGMATKTHDAAAADSFWARVQAPDSPGDSVGLAARSIALPTSSGWERREIVFEVDPDADQIQFGVELSTRMGTHLGWSDEHIWVDDPRLEVVGTDIPVTPAFSGEKHIGEWLLTGPGARGYTASADPDEKGAVRTEASATTGGGEVYLVRSVPAEGLRGKIVHTSFDVRTSKADGAAVCLLSVQQSRDMLGAGKLASDSKFIPWAGKAYTRCDLSARVSEKSKWVFFGARFMNPGTGWVKGGTTTESPSPSTRPL